MKKLILLLFVMVNYVFADDLTISKDSLKVYNNTFSSLRDQLIIKNSSDKLILLDSAYFLCDNFDTTGMFGKIEVHWMEYMYGDFGWYLSAVKQNKFKLEKHFFSPNDTAIPLRFFPAETCVLTDFQIGNNLVSERIPVYPKYIKGYLHLYFSNKQVVMIKLYSDDLRTHISSHSMVGRKNSAVLQNEYFLLNGKKVFDYKYNAKKMNLITLKRNVK